jgi:L-rhamnose mutarotase
MKKYAWTWTIKEEYLEEYVRLHKNPWPEIMEAHSRAGFRNYSIFQNGRQFFYVFECKDIQYARDYVAQDEACVRWNNMCMKMMEMDFGSRVESGITYMGEVFYLE